MFFSRLVFSVRRQAATVVLGAAVLAGCDSPSEPVPLAERDCAPADDESNVAPAPASDASALPDELRDESIEGLPRINFVHGYAEGWRHAKATGKPMLVFFTAEWCRYCHQMAAEAFGQQSVVALSDRFVCVEIDADAERDVCQQFRVQAFPTVQFVSVRGVPLNRIVGKKPGRDVVLAMQAALESVSRRTSPLDPMSR